MLSFEETNSGVKINSHNCQDEVGSHSKFLPITLSVLLALRISYVQMWLIAELHAAIDNLVKISGS